MSYVRVGLFWFEPGVTEDTIRKTQENTCTFLENLPGFISYRAVVGPGERAASFSVWQTKAQADEAERRMREWINHTAQSLLACSEVLVGEMSVEREEQMSFQPSRGASEVIPEARH